MYENYTKTVLGSDNDRNERIARLRIRMALRSGLIFVRRINSCGRRGKEGSVCNFPAITEAYWRDDRAKWRFAMDECILCDEGEKNA